MHQGCSRSSSSPKGVRVFGTAAAAAIAFLVPIFGALAFVLVLGERVPPTLALGGAIVLAGL
jgi:drug/metabolite transporter (DMT)-like permease